MERSISAVSRSAPESPINTSAPSQASARLRRLVSLANSALYSLTPSRPTEITPLRSSMKMFCLVAPMLTSSRMQAMAAAPAPRQTMRASASCLPWISSAFISPAAVTMAVPC